MASESLSIVICYFHIHQAANDPANTSPASPRPGKRRRGNVPSSVTDGCLADNSHSNDYSYSGKASLCIGDTQDIINYYEGALKHFQQSNCRVVARAFIKFIEPHKQTNHPYKGRHPPPGSPPGSTRDPEKTKPEWWPPGVMHKEPDHLRKYCMFLLIIPDSFPYTNCFPADRIQLLLHIIRKLEGNGITAAKLKTVASDTKRSLKNTSDVEIIFEILQVREMEERYERGEVDGSTPVYVVKRGLSHNGDETEGSIDGPTVTDGTAGHVEEGPLTLSSSIEQSASPLNTPIDMLGMPACSIPDSFTPARQLIFESGQSLPSNATTPQYTGLFSKGMYSYPVSVEIPSPHNAPASDYLSQNAFPTSVPNRQRGGLPSPFDTWSTPFSFPPYDHQLGGL